MIMTLQKKYISRASASVGGSQRFEVIRLYMYKKWSIDLKIPFRVSRHLGENNLKIRPPEDMISV